MRHLKTAALVLFLAVPVLVPAQEKSIPLSYDLKVSIEPQAGSIAVQGTVQVPLESAQATTFKFNLHETLDISKLLVNGKAAAFTFAPAVSPFPLPASRGVVVNLPAGLTQNSVRMDIAYSGRMKVLPEYGTSSDFSHSLDDQINSRMVELAGYSSWYPQFLFGQPLQAKLSLSLPQGWISICSGKKLEEKVRQSHIVTSWSSPQDMDILILASPSYKLKSIREPGIDLDIYHTRMPEQFIGQEGKQIAGVLKLYTDELGSTNIPNGTVKHVYSPKRKGQGKAGIARPGLIVTSEGLTLEALAQDPNFSLFQGIAHEIGHYWWNFGVGQGDWINEAFAEYFSAIAVEKLSSEVAFRAVMADYRKEVAELPSDAPSLSAVPVAQQSSFVVRYYKGALMLDTFRNAMGDQAFFKASREFFETYRGKLTGTPEFRSFWKSKLASHEELVDVWLDSRGGPPDTAQTRARN